MYDQISYKRRGIFRLGLRGRVAVTELLFTGNRMGGWRGGTLYGSLANITTEPTRSN